MDQGVYAARKGRFAEAQKHLPVLIEICKRYFGHDEVRQATEAEDKVCATDLVALEKLRIACKVRSMTYRFYGDFGLRSEASGPYEAEYDKILDGAADYLLYCFEDHGQIVWWQMIDLHHLQLADRHSFIGCRLPKEFKDADEDIFVKATKFDDIHPRYGKLLLEEGPYPLQMETMGDGFVPRYSRPKKKKAGTLVPAF